jgi:hypothetical protein
VAGAEAAFRLKSFAMTVTMTAKIKRATNPLTTCASNLALDMFYN